MAKKENKEKEKQKQEIRKIEQALDKYLKDPSIENAQELRKLEYVPVAEGRLAKLGNKILKPIMGILDEDDSPTAADLLKQIASASSRPLWARLQAIETLKSRKAEYDESLRKSLIEIGKVAKKDDAEAAKKLFPTLDTALQEAFAEAVIEHRAAKALEGASLVASDKASVKILRRAAHSLASMGQKVAEIEAKGESIYKPPEKQEPQAFVSHIDSAGKRIIILLLPGVMGGTNIFQGMVDEKVGLEDFQGVEANRRSASTLLKHAKEEKLIEVDVVYASHLLDKAAAVANTKSTNLPPDYLAHRAMLPAIPGGYKPVDPREKLPSPPSKDDARQAVSLFERDDFFTWVPDIDNLRPVQLRLDEITTSKVIINEAQKKEQIDKALNDGAAKYLAVDGAERLAARLENAAYLFVAREKFDAARLALAAADDIREYALVVRDTGTNPVPPDFVLEMFRRAFPNVGKVEKEEKPGDAGGGSRIIAP